MPCTKVVLLCCYRYRRGGRSLFHIQSRVYVCGIAGNMYSYIVREDNSSVYHALIEVISKKAEWIRKTGDSVKANLIIGERNTLKVPFGRLGHDGILQLVNCYRGSGRLSRKTALITALTNWKEATQEDFSSWLPETYIIRPQKQQPQSAGKPHPTGSGESDQIGLSSEPVRKKLFHRAAVAKPDQRQELRHAHARRKEEGSGMVWIAKSSSGLKGEGILISSDCEELVSFVDSMPHAHVVQKYIENPLLLPGHRKFDIRCWVVLDHQYNIHLMKEGVLRTCAEPYQSHDLSNHVCHLTNHCIQEAHSKDFGKFEEGNEMFFTEFNKILQEQWNVTLEDKILPQVHSIVRTSCQSVKEELCTDGLSYHSFQLFGFDFMVDTDLRVWLLEVNSAPACAQKLLPELVEGMIAVAIDPVFPPERVETEGEGAAARVFQKL